MLWTSNRVTAVVLAVVAAGLGGCDESSIAADDAADDAAVEAHRKHVNNAPVINTASLNGWTLNGWTLNGSTFNGWTLNGWTLNGWTLNGMSLLGSSFQATQLVPGLPQQVSGEDLVGAQMTLTGWGSVFVLTLEDVWLDEGNPAGEVYLYDISVYDILKGELQPLCTVNGQAAPAIALRNHWDPVTGDRIDDANVVTFACRGGALAKCVDWGYLPWETGTRCDGNGCDEVSLADYHQACTRMVRADYCGDGTPHTLNGTPIDIYDGLSPQIQAPSTVGQQGWGVEAEWGPEGARCIGSELRLQLFEDMGTPVETPECLAQIENIPGCGDLDASRGASVADRYCDEWSSAPGQCQ